MSAIWGCIEFDKEKCSVNTMASEYQRKCKLDSITEIQFENALMGMGQQIINDEDVYEKMPYIVDDGKTSIVADCIIDDRELLMDELQVEVGEDERKTIPNGRLICLAYEKWHYDFVKHIKGIFSIAIYSSDEKKLFICTDRTSSRCLYYYKGEKSCVFSTLISPIKKLYPNIPQNEMYLKDFLLIPGLMPNISSNETPWENVFMIEAGCSVTITENSVSVNRYWEPVKYDLPYDIDILKEKFLDVYGRAVERATRTNAGVAIALSGGFDSASVAALAAPKLARQGKNLISYTYVPHYDMSKYYDSRQLTDESEDVKEIAKMYPNIETNFVDNDGKSFWVYIDEMLDIMEIPFKAFVNLPQLLEIYRAANDKGCKIFLNGQTGNTSVSYGSIDDAVYELCRKKMYFSAFKYFNNFCKISGLSRKESFLIELKRIIGIQKAYGNLWGNGGKQHTGSLSKQPELTREAISPFVNPELLEDYSFADRNKSETVLRGNFAIDLQEQREKKIFFLPAFSYIGAMETKLGLYTGIVIRDSTRDSDVLEFCLSYPFEYYSYEGIPRYLIRGFMQELLPRCILYPVIKTGIQSADWILRLRNIKDEIKKEILQELKNESVGNYLNVNEISDNLEKKFDFSFEDEEYYMQLFIVYLFVRYRLLQN
nr:asparagine synthetase B family protein [uncultured Butyrivibrio sp.]